MKVSVSKDDIQSRRRTQSLFIDSSRINVSPLIISPKALPSLDNNALSSSTPDLAPNNQQNQIRKGKDAHLSFYFWEPIIGGLIIFPITLSFWLCGWNFITVYLTTDTGKHPAVLPTLYGISQLILFFMYISQNRLYNHLVQQKRYYIRFLLLECYIFIISIVYVIQWTSMWTIWDFYTSDDWLILFLLTIIGVLALIVISGHPCDLVCAPVVMSYDSIEYNVRIDHSFVADEMNDVVKDILNYFFNEHIVFTLSVMAWRAAYTLLDVCLYPDNLDLSAGLCLLIGYVLFFILMYTQVIPLKPFKFMNLNFPEFFENCRHVCIFISCVLVWRGFWVLFDEHVATSAIVVAHPYLFYSMLLIVSFIPLAVMKTASSLNGPTCEMPDQYNIYPLYSNCYVRQCFASKKRHKQTSIDDTPPLSIVFF